MPGFLIKCSNLQRGDSMKDPVSIFGCWRGFLFFGSPRGALASPFPDATTVTKTSARFQVRYAPGRSMNDRELSRAIADFEDASSAESVGSLVSRIETIFGALSDWCRSEASQ